MTTSAGVSIIGAGMKSNPGVTALMFETLSQNGINIEMISTSSIRISCVMRAEKVADPPFVICTPRSGSTRPERCVPVCAKQFGCCAVDLSHANRCRWSHWTGWDRDARHLARTRFPSRRDPVLRLISLGGHDARLGTATTSWSKMPRRPTSRALRSRSLHRAPRRPKSSRHD